MLLSIRTRVILIVSAIIAVMASASVIIGITLTRNNLIKTIENDMSVSGVIAEQLIAEKVAHIRSVMRLVAEKCRDLDEAQIKEVLVQAAADHGYLDIGLINPDATITAYGVKPPDYRLPENENAKRAMRGETVMSTTQFNNHGDFVMRFWLPLESGRTLVVSLPGTVISDVLSEFRIWDSGNIFALDHQGVMIANMRPHLVYGRHNFITEYAENVDDFRNIAEVFSRMASGETGVGEYNYAGVSRICAYRPIAGTDGWSLGVVAPLVESPVSQVMNSFLVSGAVFLGLGILAAFLTSGSVAHPFAKMKEFALVAESASEAKSHFLANMSHEMRTPLNAIIGFAELELGKEKEEDEKGTAYPVETRESLEKIYGSGVTLLGLINDILDISKIESGKFELVPVNYDMPSLLNDTVVLNIVRIGSKPITFKLDIDENLPARLFGDELRIKQIFNNLLSNAFKYTKEGTVILRIRCERDDAGVWMNCSVSDTGMGIREEDVDKLFGEYNQVDTKSNRYIEGTGLGLAITKRIVEMMNGTISVTSEYGKGTTFTLRLFQGFVSDAVIGKELAENLMEFRYIMARQDRHKQLVRSHIPYARVLVVDDVATNLDLARGILKPYGMTVDCVTSGPAAIELIRQAEPLYNAIFMDHMMPGMDGLETVRIIRNEINSDYARTIPIVALTANAIIGNEKLFLNNGFQDFLTKPIDIIKMNDAINRWVRDKKLEKELGIDTESRITEGSQGAKADPKDKADGNIERQIADLIRSVQVEGLDTKKGLERFEGDGKFYMEALRSYVVHTPALLETARAIGVLSDYAITVHGIKGSSYGISADPVGRKAEELEHAAKAGNVVFVKAENENFIRTVEAFITNLTGLLEMLEEKIERPHRAAPDPALLARLRDAAEKYDMGELDSTMEELEQCVYESDAELVSWLREQIDKSEFEEILERLIPRANKNVLLTEEALFIEA